MSQNVGLLALLGIAIPVMGQASAYSSSDATFHKVATPTPLEDHQLLDLQNLLVILTSMMSVFGILFAYILVAHTPQLKNTGNYLFMCVLGMNLIQSIEYFSCIFFVEIRTKNTEAKCDGCGFVEQFFSFCEPCMNLVFWIHTAMECNGFAAQVRRKFAVCLAPFVAGIGLGSSFWGLAGDMYAADGQAWCWISEKFLWFRVAFCWGWIILTVAVMVFVVVQALLSRNSKFFKKYFKRRGALVVTWAAIQMINVIARYVKADWLLVIQAGINPLAGVANVVSFLWSEDHLSWYAIGRSPCEECPKGFSTALKMLASESAGSESLLSSTEPYGEVAAYTSNIRRDTSPRIDPAPVSYGTSGTVELEDRNDGSQSPKKIVAPPLRVDADLNKARNRPSVEIWNVKRPQASFGGDSCSDDFFS